MEVRSVYLYLPVLGGKQAYFGEGPEWRSLLPIFLITFCGKCQSNFVGMPSAIEPRGNGKISKGET